MILKKISLEEWNTFSENAHLICFNEERPADMNTFDYALLVVDESDKPVAYSTIIEMDKLSVYMQHGGAFPDSKGTIRSTRAYHLMVSYLKEHYGRINTRIRNTNTPMLKLALSAGLLVNGIDYLAKELFLNLYFLKGE